MIPIASPTPPKIRDLLDALKQEIFYGLNCHEVGRIVSFDADKQTAQVQISVLRQLPGNVVPYPLLTDCPVFFPSGGDASLTIPIAAGDTCLVLFNDRDLDNWFTSGGDALANTSRAHDLSDGLVLVGFRNLTNQLSDYSTTDPELRNGTGRVGIDPNGKVSVRNTSGSLLQGLDTLFTNLDTLCSALTAWVNTGGSTPNPATVTAINAVKTSLTTNKAAIDALLK